MSDENLNPEEDDLGHVTVAAPDSGEDTEGEPPVDDTEVEGAEPTLEDVAARMGWSPRDQWKGDPDKWKPASEFVSSTLRGNGVGSQPRWSACGTGHFYPGPATCDCRARTKGFVSRIRAAGQAKAKASRIDAAGQSQRKQARQGLQRSS